MAKSANQRLKLYYILDIFQKFSDEEHLLTLSDIIYYLEEKGVSAERKAVYRDIEALEALGYDIIKVRNKHFCYYLGSREFENAELRLLVDAVQASKFITKQKSERLIKKLESLTTVYGAERLQSGVFVTNRIKSSNESIYYNVDFIDEAMCADAQITFFYFDRDMHRRRVYRHNKKIYRVSPWALVWNHENYYMVAYDSDDKKIKHYRADKMDSIRICEDKREGRELFRDIDLAEYSQRFFGMFDGSMESVTLDCDAGLANAVIDKFGKNVIMRPSADGTRFTAQVRVAVSPVFLSWVFMFGGDIRIIDPQPVADALRRTAEKFIN